MYPFTFTLTKPLSTLLCFLFFYYMDFIISILAFYKVIKCMEVLWDGRTGILQKTIPPDQGMIIRCAAK